MALTAGDFAFVGYNADGEDDFAIVVLKDITSSETVFFTDDEWLGAAFAGGESTLRWDTGTIAAGTVVAFSNVAQVSGSNTTLGTVSHGTIDSASGGYMSLSTAGDTILAYQGSSGVASGGFIAGMAYDETGWAQSGGQLPSGLTLGQTAIDFGTAVGGVQSPDSAIYIGDRSSQTDLSDYAALANTPGNWTIAPDGFDGETNLPFSTTAFAAGGADVSAPALASFTPADNSFDVAASANLVLTFNETVEKGSGNIVIHRKSDDAVIQTIDINSGNVSVAGDTVTVNPPADLSTAERYYVQIDAGAFTDVALNPYAGLSSTSVFSFTTVLPTLSAAPAGISAGSIAFTGFNASGQTDDISFVVLEDLDGSTNPFQIFFSNGAWNGTSFTQTDRVLTWTVDELVTAGTVVNFTDFGSNSGNEFDTINSDVGLITRSVSMGLNTSGDPFYAYVGAANAPRAGDGFLAAFTTEGTGFTAAESLVNTGLTLGVHAADFGSAFGDGSNGAAFVGDRSSASTFADYAAVINGSPLSADWTNIGEGDGETLSPFSATRFTLGADLTPPNLAASTPADGAAAVAVDANIVLTFNETIQKGSTGDIRIYDKIGDTLVETIAITSGAVTASGTMVTINPISDLEQASSYYVQIDSGAIEDTSGNAFGGIADETTLNFTTVLPTTSVPGFGVGDIAFVGLNASSTESLAFVALRDLDGSSTPFEIFFTDQAWEGAGFVSNGDGTLTLTIAELIPAGTVVSLSNVNNPGSETYESSHGVLVNDGGFNHATAGDITWAYIGTKDSPTAFLSAIATDELGFGFGTNTLTGTGLTEGTNAVSFAGYTGVNSSPPGVEYMGARTALTSFADYRALINQDPTVSSNWTIEPSTGDNILPFSLTAFSINQIPVVDLNGPTGGIDSAAAFVEATDQGFGDGNGVALASLGTLSDPDGDTLASVTLALTNDQDGADERLSIASGSVPAGVSVTGNNTDTITLTLSGGTNADLQTALQAVRWQNDSDAPSTTARTVTVTANDGTANGAVATSTISVTASDDPSVAVDDSFSVDEDAILTAGSGANVLAANPTTADSDPDGAGPLVTAINGSSGDVGNTITLGSGATVLLQADGSLTYNPNGQFDALPSAASGNAISQAVDSFTYTVSGGDMATVQITINGVDSDDTLNSGIVDQTLDGGIGFNTLDTGGIARDSATLVRVSPTEFTLTSGGVTDDLTNINKILFSDRDSWWESAPERFSALSATRYGGSQDAGSATVSGDGSELTVGNNGWKQIEINKTITADTVLRFDFASDGEGEVHGIGFDTDSALSDEFFFQIDGTQDYGLQYYNGNYTTGSGVQSYEIRVGDLFTGTFDYLTLATDNDAGLGADSRFSNISFVEIAAPPSNVNVDGVPSAVQGYGPRNGQDQGLVTISPDGSEISLSNNAWKTVTINKTITADTVLRFDFQSTGEGEIHGIGFNTGGGLAKKFFFQLDGTQEYGLQFYDDLYTTGSGPLSYEIRVGDIFTGDFTNLVLTSDNDAGEGANSVFSNITFAEVPRAAQQVEVNGIASALSSFGFLNGKDQGLATVSVDQTEVSLSNNAWKKIEIDELISANTILQFRYSSDVGGEIHGIGFDNDELLSDEFFFQLHGSQDYGLQLAEPDYVPGSGFQTYQINVGNFFTGDFDYIVLATDNDFGIGANAVFQDIELFDL